MSNHRLLKALAEEVRSSPGYAYTEGARIMNPRKIGLVLTLLLLITATTLAQDWRAEKERGLKLVSESPAQAIEILEGALQSALQEKGREDKETGLLHGYIGKTYFQLQKYEESAREFGLCRKLLTEAMPYPSAEASLWQSQALYQTKNYQGCRDALEYGLGILYKLKKSRGAVFPHYLRLARLQADQKVEDNLKITAERYLNLLDSGLSPDPSYADVQELAVLAYKAHPEASEKLLLKVPAMLDGQTEPDESRIVRLAWLALVQTSLDKNRQAVETYEQLLALLQGPEHEQTLIQSEISLGIVLVRERRWEEAIERLKRVKELPPGALHTEALIKLGECYRYIGHEQLALEMFDQAAPSASEKQTKHLLGHRVSCLTSLGRFDEALSVTQSLLKLQESDKALERGETWGRRARVFLHMSRNQDALEALEIATTLLKDSDGQRLGLILATTAQVLFSRGDFQMSVDVGERAILQLEKAEHSLPRAVAQVRKDQARRLMFLSNPKAAELQIIKAAEIYQECLPARHPEMLETAFTLAQILAKQGRVKECLALMKPYITKLEDLYEPGDVRLGRAHNLVASLLSQNGQREEARLHLQRAEEIYKGDTFQRSMLLAELAINEARMGNLDEGFARASEAADIAIEFGSKKTLNSLEILDIATEIALLRYRKTKDQQSLVAADKWISLATQWSRDTRELVDDRSRREQSRRLLGLYPRAVEVAVAKGQTDRALEFAELATSRALLELMAGNQRPDAARERMRGLLGNVGVDLESSRASKIVEPKSVEELQASIRQNEAVIYLLMGHDVSHGFLMTSQELHYFPLPDRQELDSLSLKLSKQIADGQVRAQVVGAEQLQERERQELGNLLWKSIPAEQLANLKEKTLLIVPTGRLLEVPFEALPALPGESGRFLIENHPVFYAPSLSLLAHLRERPKSTTEPKTLVVANPIYSDKPNVLASRYRSQDSELSFAPLPFTKVEAESIQRELGSTNCAVWLGAEASEEKIQNTPLDEYRVLHFACHGILGRNRGLPPSLVLSQKSTDDVTDGFLTMNEVGNLTPNLQAELVVLSACQTGRGYFQPGEGVEGMARAFLRSGAQSVLVSLWTVDDRSTAQLMTRFYRYLHKDGMKPSRALQRARLDLLKEGKTPRHWAPFILMGDDRSVF